MADWILEPRFVRVTASAVSTRQDLLDAIAAGAADPRFERARACSSTCARGRRKRK